MFNSILIVCVGNICRSPTAEFLFKDALNKENKPAIKVASAGLAALKNKNIDAKAFKLLQQELKINENNHHAQQISSKLIAEFDLILVMEKVHKQALLDSHPEARGKVFLIGKWIENKEIPDPYRKSDEAFEHVYKLLKKSVTSWIERL